MSQALNIGRVKRSSMALFMGARYLAYVLQFVTGLLIARFLGPYVFGVWGFLSLVLQYLSYTSFGFQYAVTIQMSTDAANNVQEQERIASVAMTASATIAAILCVAGAVVYFFDIPLFTKYSFAHYAILLGFVAGLTNLQAVFTNIFRVGGQLWKIAANELISATLPLCVVLFFRHQLVLSNLYVAMLCADVIGLTIYIFGSPYKFSFAHNKQQVRQLFHIGVPLLIYAVSFYLITVSARTIVSIFYSVDMMGYYALATTLTTATMLGLNAINWVVLPDILTKVRTNIADAAVVKTVQMVNDLYSTTVCIVVFIVILLLPVLFILLPSYTPVQGTLTILLISQAIVSVAFGYNCVAIARKQQLQIAKLSLIAVVIVTSLGIAGAYAGIHYIWVAISVLLGSVAFTILQARLGASLLGDHGSHQGYIRAVLPPGRIIPFLMFLIGAIAGHATLWGLAGLCIFALTNRKKLDLLWSFAMRSLEKSAK